MKILKYTYDNQKYEIFCCNLSLSHFLARLQMPLPAQ